MKRASLILILAGGVFGLFFSVPGIVIGAGNISEGVEGGMVILLGSTAVSALSIMAIAAKMFPDKVPFASWIIPLFACLSGFVMLGFLWFPPGLLLLVGSIMSRMAEKENA